MKKYLAFLFILCCAVSFTTNAETVSAKDSFQIAKAFKLGRDIPTSSLLIHSRSSSDSSDSSNSCPTSCSKCTGRICSVCNDGYYLKNNRCLSYCSGVTCTNGGKAVVSANKCCCE